MYHSNYATIVKFSSDGNFIVSGGLDKRVNLWNLKEKNIEWSFYRHLNSV